MHDFINKIERLYYKIYLKKRPMDVLIDEDKKKALSIYWFFKYGNHINWKHPKTINEKIMWLSVYTETSLWTRYADKCLVREHLEELGLGKFLTKSYGVWDNAEDVDFSTLPESFVIKCTHDWNSTHVVIDKKKENLEEIRGDLKKHLSQPFGYSSCEPHYTKMKPRVLAEELLIQKDAPYSSSIVDYKFFCVNGKAKYCFVCYDRKGNSSIREIYDINPWKPNHTVMTESLIKQLSNVVVPEPKNLALMIQIAEKLANDFPFIRVDLYNLGDRILFSEMTFTPSTGRLTCFSEAAQYGIGEKIKLPDINNKK